MKHGAVRAGLVDLEDRAIGICAAIGCGSIQESVAAFEKSCLRADAIRAGETEKHGVATAVRVQLENRGSIRSRSCAIKRAVTALQQLTLRSGSIRAALEVLQNG